MGSDGKEIVTAQESPIGQWLTTFVKGNPYAGRALLRSLKKAIATGEAPIAMRRIQEIFPNKTNEEYNVQLIDLLQLLEQLLEGKE